MSKAKSVKDTPIGRRQEDQLGVHRHAKALADFIAETDTPITVGIQGEWGTGKTSMMRMVEDYLGDQIVSQGRGKSAAKGADVFVPIQINTWEHSLINDPTTCLFSIIEEITNELSKIDQTSINLAHAKQTILTMAKGAASVGALVTGGSADAITQGLTRSPNIKTLRLQLDRAIKQLREGGKSKIVIFIDDLDRLDPPTAVKTLELLSNLFAIEHCVFVIAIDYQVVVKGLVEKYGKPKAENEHEFRSFFDKLIQLPFMMPTQTFEVEDYTKGLLKKISFFSQSELNGMGVGRTLAILDSTIGINPRSIKRLINSLSYLKIIESKALDSETSLPLRQTVFALVCFQISFPNVYNLLAQYPEYEDWNSEFVENIVGKVNVGQSKLKEEIERLVRTDDNLFDEDWEKALFEIVWVKNWQRNRLEDISRVLNLISDEIFLDFDEGHKRNAFKEALRITLVTAVNPTDEIKSRGDQQQANQSMNEAISFWRRFSECLDGSGTCFDTQINQTYRSRSLTRSQTFAGGEELSFTATWSSTKALVVRGTNLESKLLLEKLTKTRFLRGLPSDSVEKEEAKGIGMGVSKIAIDCTEVPRLSLQKQKNSGHRDKMLEWCRTIMIGLQQELDKLSQEAT